MKSVFFYSFGIFLMSVAVVISWFTCDYVTQEDMIISMVLLVAGFLFIVLADIDKTKIV